MSVAKVTELSSTSSISFEDAIKKGLARASRNAQKHCSAWVKEQHVRCNDGKITEYQVNMMVTFVLEGEGRQEGEAVEFRTTARSSRLSSWTLPTPDAS